MKNVLGLLGSSDRRQRYVFTCVPGGEYDSSAFRLENFSATLYEARWKEVVTFLKAWLPLYPILKATWSHAKYKRGCDVNGADRVWKNDAISAFDGEKLLAMLTNDRHVLFSHMILLVDELPDKLGHWSEACPCHSALVEGLSRAQRARLFEAHYGKGITACMMGGCRAPEFAAGKVKTVVEEMWAVAESELIQIAASMHIALDSAIWLLVCTNFQQAKVCTVVMLLLKLDFWGRLPWLLCVLALADEEEARGWVDAIFEAFAVHPNGELHDPITWKWLKPSSVLRADMVKFRNGTRRRDLSFEYQVEVGALKMIPVAETTIEEKHKQISEAAALNKIGPVRVSLSMRLLKLEAKLLKGQIPLDDLLDAFEECRELKRCVHTMHFEQHPIFAGRLDDMRPQQVRKEFAKILYRCDGVSMYQDTRPVKASNQAQKRKAEALRQKLFAFGRSRVSYESVKATALVGHIGQVSSPNKVYSLKRSLICAQAMGPLLAMPPSKVANSDRGTLAPMEIETGDDNLDIDSDTVHFRILPINLANKKTTQSCTGRWWRTSFQISDSHYLAFALRQRH